MPDSILAAAMGVTYVLPLFIVGIAWLVLHHTAERQVAVMVKFSFLWLLSVPLLVGFAVAGGNKLHTEVLVFYWIGAIIIIGGSAVWLVIAFLFRED